MTEPEFDEYADDYDAMHEKSVAFSGCELGYFAEYKIAHAAKCFQKLCSANEVVLDFGCGTGNSVPYFAEHLNQARLIGVDVSQKSLDIAKDKFGNLATFLKINGANLDLESDSIGMVFSSCVFHHIKPEEHISWLQELYRVTRPGGVVLIFEHNPFNLLTRHVVAQCAFDGDAILLRPATLTKRLRNGGWTPLRTRYHVFFPGFLKKLRPFEALLGWLPQGGQYSVLALKK